MRTVSSEQGAETGAETKKQPLPLEIPVVATGARPGDTAEKRELFTEETETVLVFETGGVIRLSAAVAVGQLIFLTNKQTGKEVVAQVLRKRSYRPTACYVELDFTEPTAGFWGVEFPAEGEAKSPSRADGSVAADLADAELTEEAEGPATVPPDRAEVARLRNEVEALKSKLQTMEAGKVESPVPAQAEETKDSKVPTEAHVASEPTEEGRSYPIRMQLPKAGDSTPRTAEFAADSAAIAAAHADEHLLPKPSLDFEHFPGVEQSKQKLFSGKATRSLSRPIGALIAVALVVVAAGIATYRLGWLSGFGETRIKTEAKANVKVIPSETSPNGNVATEIPGRTTAVPALEHANERSAVESNSATTLGSEQPEQPASEPAGEITAATIKKSESHASAAVSVRSGKKVTAVNAGPKDRATTAVSQEDMYVPPKLVKAIRSLSPPEALRAYVSGVVTLNTVVDENGRVQSATPMSGPKALHKKAVDTVKDYVYQPATRNGKPVPAHVEVKIQFWYEP
jgi:TonB family protein